MPKIGEVILLVRMWVEMLTLCSVFICTTCHPPCEDVSWNSSIVSRSSRGLVILLVRMWVEMQWSAQLAGKCSRHPPCEDVSWNNRSWRFMGERPGHPPCEDVSWNMQGLAKGIEKSKVILLVRMWVEIGKGLVVGMKNTSSSLWGCELKFNRTKSRIEKASVILLVRMWVEIFSSVTKNQ